MKNLIVEYIGYGLFDARTSDSDVRGIGNSELDALISLLENLKEEEASLDLTDYSIKIAV